MTHFGLICPSSTGHLHTMIPLGQELKRRGHSVTLVGLLDSKAETLAAGLEFQAVGESEFPQGATKDYFAQVGKLSRLKAFKSILKWIADVAEIYLRDAPGAIKQAGIEALLIDQVFQAAGTVAEYLDIPFVTVCCAIVLNREISVPPFTTAWSYNTSWWALLRNQVGYARLAHLRKPITKVIQSYRQQWNLPPANNPNDTYSKIAQICQQPAELEFPRKNLPKYCHFTGPYHYSSSRDREPIPFPYEKLTGQPLIYASLGTINNRLLWVFSIIAEACMGLDAQLVISLSGGNSPESLPKLPGNPIVVGYAPKIELLKKATLIITHAGMNTVLESLTYGVPMVAIPVSSDQPGIAARIAWKGVGEFVPLGKLSVKSLHIAVRKVLTAERYKKNALQLQEVIKGAGGVMRAVDIIEEAVSTGRAVLPGFERRL